MPHIAAHWLMLAVRDAIPKARDLAKAEFTTLLLRLLKIAARAVETASHVRLAFAAASPEADFFRSLPGALILCGPHRRGMAPPSGQQLLIFSPTRPALPRRAGRPRRDSMTRKAAQAAP